MRRKAVSRWMSITSAFLISSFGFTAFALPTGATEFAPNSVNADALTNDDGSAETSRFPLAGKAFRHAIFACMRRDNELRADASPGESLGYVADDGTRVPATHPAAPSDGCTETALRLTTNVINETPSNKSAINAGMRRLVKRIDSRALTVHSARATTTAQPNSQTPKTSLRTNWPSKWQWVLSMNAHKSMSGSSFISEWKARYPRFFNWHSDGCSAPLIGNSHYNFKWPCRRHDFGYRNLKKGGRHYRGVLWRRHNKAVADIQFYHDMRSHCRQNFHNSFGCRQTAYLYYGAVATRVKPNTEGLSPERYKWY